MKLHRDLGISQKTAWMLITKSAKASLAAREARAADWRSRSGRGVHRRQGRQQARVEETARRTRRRGQGLPWSPSAARWRNRRQARRSGGRGHADPLRRGTRGARCDVCTPTKRRRIAALPTILNAYKHETVAHGVGEYVRKQAHNQRRRVVLGASQARLRRHLPQDEREASCAVRQRVRRTPQHPRQGHPRSNGDDREGHGRQAVAVEGVGLMKDQQPSVGAGGPRATPLTIMALTRPLNRSPSACFATRKKPKPRGK